MTNLKRDIRNASKDDADKIEKMNKVAGIVELIFHFSEENQVGEGLKIFITRSNAQQITNFFSPIKSRK